MTPTTFLDSLAALRFCNAFNPYSDACPEHDAPDAPLIRRNNLRLVLEAAIAGGVDSIWVARDLGYRGGRRTGLALTDEAHLSAHAGLYGRLVLAKATRGPMLNERTATVVWQLLREINRPVFLWNVFPLHPYAPGDQLSNRCHTRIERQASSHLLRWLVSSLQPKTIVAIGKDAAAALAEFDLSAVSVRHPSYGGQGEFIARMGAIYGRPSQPNRDRQLRFL